MNAFIFLVIGGIVFVVNASFRTIQHSLTTAIQKDVNLVIQNSRLSREINKTFTELNSLIRALYDEEHEHGDETQALLERVTELGSQSTSTEMQDSLKQLSEDLSLLFVQGETIRETLRQLQDSEDRLFSLLDDVEELLAEKLVILTMEGKNSSGLSQLNTLIPGYREALLRIGIQLGKTRRHHAGNIQDVSPDNHEISVEEAHPTLFLLFHDLSLHFQTLLASDDDLAEYGRQLIDKLEDYKQQAASFHENLTQLDLQIVAVSGMQNHLQGMIDDSDDRIEQTTEKIQEDVGGIMGNSQRIILLLTLIVLVVVAIGWFVTHWMTRPLLELSFVAAQLADGNLACKISEIRSRDEIGTLARAFKDLLHYFREMANTATEISQGNLDLEVRPRSKKDVFGNSFQQMIHYLKGIGDIASQVAEGDLRSQVELQSSKDQLGRTFQNMQDSLVGVIEGIRSGADYLSSISTEVLNTSTKNSEALGHIGNAADVTSSAMMQMNASAEDVHLSTEHLRSSVDETSSSISEMISSVKHIAENSRKLSSSADSTVKTVSQIVQSLEKVADQAEHSKTLSEATTEDATYGQKSMEQMIAKMEAISDVTERISEIISSLGERSMEIGTILDVINEVAEQTSLLALNASIIAAQAGTHGRGFAVVADEIKELAMRVGTSTKEISQIIKRVQKDSSDAAEVIEQGRREVEIGVHIANETGTALNKIGESADNSSKVAAEIAVLVRQQSSSSSHVADSMKDVANMISEISGATEEQERNSSQLLQIVENMQALAEQVLHAMKEQQQSTQHVTDFMSDVTTLVNQNKPTVEQLARTAHELSEQAAQLNQQVERFIIPDNQLPGDSQTRKELPL